MIAIDFLSSLEILNYKIVYSGGANYAKRILKEIKQVYHSKVKIIVPKGFVPDMEDGELFQDEKFILEYADNLLLVEYQNIDTLFLPQVNGQVLRIIPAIKKKNTNLRICATLHDRQHNIFRFDWYDRYYLKNPIESIMLFFKFYLKQLMFKIVYNRSLRYIDTVYTVSNYSMQNLMNKKLKQIVFYTQLCDNELQTNFQVNLESFILFVSGGRPEKNLLRTLEAFCLYKKNFVTKENMIITGVPDNIKNRLIKTGKLDVNIIESYIQFKPYVSYQELNDLYKNCKYVVFTSKGEGYGLPIREALNFGKPVLASRVSSIPEVVGAAALYVDPFNVKSIYEGFVQFGKEKILRKYTQYILERKYVIDELSNQDGKIMLEDLFELE